MVFGHGRKQRRIQAAETDRTSAIAESIAQDKEMTRTLLARGGRAHALRPAGQGRRGRLGRRPSRSACRWWSSRRTATRAAAWPPTSPPANKSSTAYEAARQESESILVEKFAPGHDYRLLVVGERVVAAARREPAQVLGDGMHTVAQLIEQANADPRRGEHHATVLSKIKLDAIALAVLADQGLRARVGSRGRHRRC